MNIKLKYIAEASLFCMVFTGLFICLSFFKHFIPATFERLAHGIIGTIAAMLTTYLFLKFDKKSFADIGLQWEDATLPKFVIGIGIGIALMGLVEMAVIYFSDFKITLNSNSNLFKFLFYTLPLIPLSFMEEVGFRAYPLKLLKEKTTTSTSILVTSILFGLYHIANGWSVESAMLGAGVWGIFFGTAAVHSAGISLPTGLHYAINLSTAAFGISNSSFNIWILRTKDGQSLENYHGSHLMTLVPEIGLLLLAILCMVWLTKKSRE